MLTTYHHVIFYFSLLAIIYIYIGYPILLKLISWINQKHVNKKLFYPNVTIIISAYNEQNNIEATLKNKLALDYPSEKLEIIVVSDNSTDSTESIVKKFKKQGIKLLVQKPRRGKTAALNLAYRHALGEILIFSDANSIYSLDALKHIIKNFYDPMIGYVTGKMIYVNESGSIIGDGCTKYMKYENYLRSIETKLGSVVGVDGGIDAIRKSKYVTMKDDQLPDFILPLQVVKQGYRVVYEPDAILREYSLNQGQDEYRMRVRVALRALWALFDMRGLFNVFKYGLFSFQLFSHKLLRYFGFLFIVLLYLSNLLLISLNNFFLVSLIFQTVFYLMAFLSYIFESKLSKIRFFFIPYYFALVNLGFAEAFIKFIFRKKQIMWTPRKG